uniref:Uncharacterized protein n=1 Tax=Zea mays TaxID=4577 RepID=C0P6F7_MAIZE|nr:unknown [Zea mays]
MHMHTTGPCILVAWLSCFGPPHDPELLARTDEHLPWHVAGEHEVAVLVLVGDGELASAVGRGGEAAEERVQRVPQLTVAAVGPQVHLPEVWRPVHAHLHVQASSSLLLAPPGPPRLRRRVERVLPVHSHRRPPHHLHLGGRCGVVMVMVVRPGRLALHHRRRRPFRRRQRRLHDVDDVSVAAAGRTQTQLCVDHLHGRTSRAPIDHRSKMLAGRTTKKT